MGTGDPQALQKPISFHFVEELPFFLVLHSSYSQSHRLYSRRTCLKGRPASLSGGKTSRNVPHGWGWKMGWAAGLTRIIIRISAGNRLPSLDVLFPLLGTPLLGLGCSNLTTGSAIFSFIRRGPFGDSCQWRLRGKRVVELWIIFHINNTNLPI